MIRPAGITAMGLAFLVILCQPASGALSERAKLLAALGADDSRFGSCTAVNGIYAVVGAPADDDHGSNSGAAYVLELAAGNWKIVQKLTASDAADYDQFGISVAIEGDYIVVGAYGDDDAGSFSGSAYIFQRTETGWHQLQKLTPSDGQAHHFFGNSVAVRGHNAIVGANGDDTNGTDSGSAYIFRQSGGLWSQTEKLTPSDGTAGDYFGTSVAMDGNRAVAGAPGDDESGNNDGSAYVFEYTGDSWIQTQKLTAAEGASDDQFGSSVAVSSDSIIVGAHLDDANGTNSGSAYVFQHSEGAWSQLQKLNPSDANAESFFGCSVSICGPYALVGASGDDGFGAQSGAAYLFKHEGATWIEYAKLTPSDYAPWDFFGSSVSISDGHAVVGAPSHDGLGSPHGTAYVFKVSAEAWCKVARVVPWGGWPKDRLARSVAVDGDYAIVGAPGDDEKGSSAGSAYVFRRLAGASWNPVAKLTASDGDAYDRFGVSVAISGDYVVVGAYGDDANGIDSGSAYIFQNSNGAWSQLQKLEAADGDEDDGFGTSAAISGNYVVIGATDDEPNGTQSGSAYVFQRDGSVWAQVQKLVPSDGIAEQDFGTSVAADGNCAFIGASGDDDKGSGSGSVYVFECNAGDWRAVQKLGASDGNSGDYFGGSVAVSGDYAVIGAPYHDANGDNSGAAYVFNHAGSIWSQFQKLVPSDGNAGDYFGCSVSVHDDRLIAGAYGDDDAASHSGSAYVFRRSEGAWSQQAKLTASDAAEDDFLGSSVAISAAYAIVGAYQDDDRGENAGAAYVFSLPWTGGGFEFDDGTTQCWLLGGAYDEEDRGPLPSDFIDGWSDSANYPNMPPSDPLGDASGSVQMYTSGGHGIDNACADRWMMQFQSPDLSVSEGWQYVAGYTAEIAENVSGANTVLYANLGVRVYDIDRSLEVEFYNGTEQALNWNEWNRQTFRRYDTPDFPENYVVRGVFVNVWGMLSDGSYLNGGVYLDEVQPFGVSLRYPNGGEFIIQGDTCPITWDSLNIDEVKVEYSADNGSSWAEVDPCNTGNTNRYDWLVPRIDSDKCLVRITDANDPNVSDTSDGTFAIRPPIKLLTPDGGERLIAGTTYRIIWDTYVGKYQNRHIVIDYSTDNGLTWTEVDPPNKGNPGLYDWLVPPLISDYCLVRISIANVPSVFDTSNDTFRIRLPGLFVDADANGLNDGTSWANAFNHLQDALADVTSGEDIMVAEGIYRPDQGTTVMSGDRTAAFRLITGVGIFGGYAGFGEPDPNTRDIRIYETILSGDLNGDDDYGGDGSENSYHVVSANNVDANAILDGFTIIAGNADGLETDSLGGGILNVRGDPTVANCTFAGNSALYGGGMWNGGPAQPDVAHCTFINNWAGAGAGMANEDAGPTVSSCSFFENHAVATEWTTGIGGAIYDLNTSATVTNCTFNGNRADDDAGAIYNGAAGDLVLINCAFSGNTSSDAAGGLYSADSNSTLINCTLSENTANSGGGLYCCAGAGLDLQNCVIWANNAAFGPQIGLADYSSASVSYCDLQGGVAAIADDGTGSVTEGLGNSDQDPIFANAAGFDGVPGTGDDDLRLAPGSPCIDVADGNAVPVGVTTDLDGHPRLADGDCSGTTNVDMGPYEFAYVSVGDFDGDCDIDFADYVICSLAWLARPADAHWNPLCDISVPADELIDIFDFALFADYWLAGKRLAFYDFTLDSDPGWTTQGEWAFGEPAGGGAIKYGNPDPTAGYTGQNVYGVNLSGDYGTTLGGPYYLIAGPLDCRDYHKIRLKFARWLNTDESNYVAGKIELSDDGADWTTIWEHTGTLDITDDSWRIMEYDVHTLADRQPTIYVRWSYAIIQERAYPYSGWNIDDIQLLGIYNR
jgi:predicted amidohydrolase